MGKFKVNSGADNYKFQTTRSYKKLYQKLKELKNNKGQIIHVTGAPGTGKSANIYHALGQLKLKVFNVKFRISSADASSKEVFNAIFNDLRDDLHLKPGENIYNQLSQFDAVLIADAFHDAHLKNSTLVGYSQWTDNVGFKSLYFYLLCIKEYLTHHDDFKHINLVLQTSWRIYIRGKKYDLFSDLGILSRLLVFILRSMFTVVEISYSDKEVINIVKNHLPHTNDDLIKVYIKRYGYKPRFICHALERNDI